MARQGRRPTPKKYSNPSSWRKKDCRSELSRLRGSTKLPSPSPSPPGSVPAVSPSPKLCRLRSLPCHKVGCYNLTPHPPCPRTMLQGLPRLEGLPTSTVCKYFYADLIYTPSTLLGSNGHIPYCTCNDLQLLIGIEINPIRDASLFFINSLGVGVTMICCLPQCVILRIEDSVTWRSYQVEVS